MMKIAQKSWRTIALVAAYALALIGLALLSPDDAIRRKVFAHKDDMLTAAVANIDEPLKKRDTPVYWHIAKSGGSSMKVYYGCMDLVLATQRGTMEGHEHDKRLQVWVKSRKAKFVNVDTASDEGIDKAKRLGLAKSGLADVIFTQNPPKLSAMFRPNYRARFFALFRHPIERAASMFHYSQVASWEAREDLYHPERKDKTFEQWLKEYDQIGEFSNFYMKRLLNKFKFTDEDLETAKEIIRTKFIVGLLTEMEESVERFDKYFGWHDKEVRPECQKQSIQTGYNRNPHDLTERGGEAWNILAAVNEYDLPLYAYIVELYHKQGELFRENKAEETA